MTYLVLAKYLELKMCCTHRVIEEGYVAAVSRETLRGNDGIKVKLRKWHMNDKDFCFPTFVPSASSAPSVTV
eukprot:m.31047 g.31047  ORF g.31047 m.31047 type:complete len:72 (-) comp10663_c0_seq3:900-1115(-)